MLADGNIVRVASRWLLNAPRGIKQVLLIGNDLVLLSFALWLGFSLRLNLLYTPPFDYFGLILLAAPIIGVATFQAMGLYRLVTRFIGPGGTIRLISAVALSVLLWVLLVQLADVDGILPRASIIIYFLLAAALIWSSRQVAGWFFRSLPDFKPVYFEGLRKNVLIYGAGKTGVQLLESLRYSREYQPVAFVDENRSLWGQVVSGLKVHKPSKLVRLIEKRRVSEILLAIPEDGRQRQRTVIRRLEALNVVVKTLPAIEDIASGKVQISDLRHIGAEDLLGRDPVPPDPLLLARNVRNKAVLVTGAGGSIGSELSRQILKLDPQLLVLLDVSEAALFEIERDLLAIRARLTRTDEAGAGSGPGPIIAVLGSVLDEGLVRRTIRQHGIHTIYHAAAYKHVPMVELNPTVGIENNTFGTMIVADAAKDLGVERMVLVSTDKAVRPTNIMGASKRLAEQYLQALAQDAEGGTVFTMVRFGNVLDSSGSVVRLFREQIERGGPVTVTHPEILRYFMSIPEAAELVVQAAAMAHGGEVFVLDMGEPVKIDDLARTMIRLMGLEIKDSSNPNGDIEIVYTGLRQGEKLFEELLLNELTSGTAHPRIGRSREPTMTLTEIRREFDSLRIAMTNEDVSAVHAVLRRSVEGYTPDTRHLIATATEGVVASRNDGRTLH
jgi:FlaA1/EpsC-like NDP-sugar epimerase